MEIKLIIDGVCVFKDLRTERPTMAVDATQATDASMGMVAEFLRKKSIVKDYMKDKVYTPNWGKLRKFAWSHWGYNYHKDGDLKPWLRDMLNQDHMSDGEIETLYGILTWSSDKDDKNQTEHARV